MKYPNLGTIIDWDSINAFISVLRFLKEIKVAMRPKAWYFLLVKASPIDTSVEVSGTLKYTTFSRIGFTMKTGTSEKVCSR